MKFLSLLMWVTQFGVSLVFPLLVFLWLGFWLQSKFGLGVWVVFLCGVIGFLTSVSTAKSCWRSMLKAFQECSSQDGPEDPVAFNDHT